MDALAPARELSALITGGELRRAGEWLVARHARDVIALCRSIVREQALAEDLAQDAFAQAFSSLRGYRGDAAPRTWVLSIAKNRCIDHLRRRDREPWDDLGDEGEPDAFSDDAPLPPELLLRRGDVDAALEGLAEGERALIVLRFRHGLEYAELASVFGLREGTVRMRLSRALGKMRETLEQREAVPGRARAAPSLGESVAAPRAMPAPGAPPPMQAPATRAPPPPAGRPDAPPPPSVGRVAAPSPAAYGAPPPAPASAMAPPPVGAPPKGKGLFDRLRGFFSGAPTEPAPPPTPLGAALARSDEEPSEGFARRIEALLNGLV